MEVESLKISPRDEQESKEPAAEVEELERTADALRDDLSGLVDELGRRGKRALVPAAVGVAVVGALGIGGLLLWRVRARRQLASRPRALLAAMRTGIARRFGPAEPPPQARPLVSIGAAAGAAAASVVARWAARRVLERIRQPRNESVETRLLSEGAPAR